jgi:hypothetical protein
LRRKMALVALGLVLLLVGIYLMLLALLREEMPPFDPQDIELFDPQDIELFEAMDWMAEQDRKYGDAGMAYLRTETELAAR